MYSKPSIRFFLATTLSLGLALMLGANPGLLGNEVMAQNPQPPPTKINPFPKVSLVPLVILNVGLDNVAQPVFSPTGASRPAPEFFIPRNGSKEFTVTTSGGGEPTGHFSDSVPAGVLATAFQWAQNEVPAGNAVGRLRYSGCASCPASFTIQVRALSRDSVDTAIRLSLTASSGRPVVTGITRDGDDPTGQARFEIKFEHPTFDPTDSQVVATYASGLKYRLIPETNSQFADGRMQVTIPRLEVGRSVKVSLVNPYGSSSNSTVTLPEQNTDNPAFVQVNSSNEFPLSATVFGNPAFSVKHSNTGLTAESGTDEIPIQPLATASVCNKPDFIYLGAKATWLDDNDHPTSTLGTVTIGTQPPTNALLRSPNNIIHVNFTLNPLNRDKFLQVVFRGARVVGICSDRVIH